MRRWKAGANLSVRMPDTIEMAMKPISPRQAACSEALECRHSNKLDVRQKGYITGGDVSHEMKLFARNRDFLPHALETFWTPVRSLRDVCR